MNHFQEFSCSRQDKIKPFHCRLTKNHVSSYSTCRQWSIWSLIITDNDRCYEMLMIIHDQCWSFSHHQQGRIDFNTVMSTGNDFLIPVERLMVRECPCSTKTREISRTSGMDFPILPSFWCCTDTMHHIVNPTSAPFEACQHVFLSQSLLLGRAVESAFNPWGKSPPMDPHATKMISSVANFSTLKLPQICDEYSEEDKSI